MESPQCSFVYSLPNDLKKCNIKSKKSKENTNKCCYNDEKGGMLYEKQISVRGGFQA